MIILFLISCALLVEVGAKKKENDTDTSTILIVAPGITAKLSHKGMGMIRFPPTDSMRSHSAPIMSAVPENTNAEIKGPRVSARVKGFKPSLAFPSYPSLEYLYGHHVNFSQIGDQSGKEYSPEARQNGKSYLGYYDHHHFHYFDDRARGPSPSVEIQHEPEVVGHHHHHDNFNGNHNHVNDHGYYHYHHHDNHGDGGNGFHYHGHYGPDGVVHFHNGNSEGHGPTHGGHSYSHGSGDAYHYHYNHNDNPQSYVRHNTHNHDNNYPQDIPQNHLHSASDQFGHGNFHDNSNAISNGEFVAPGRFPETQSYNTQGNQGFHYQHQGTHNLQHGNQGYNDRYPSEGFRNAGPSNFAYQDSGRNFGSGGNSHGVDNFPHDNVLYNNVHNSGPHNNENFRGDGNRHTDFRHQNHIQYFPHQNSPQHNGHVHGSNFRDNSQSQYSNGQQLIPSYLGDSYVAGARGANELRQQADNPEHKYQELILQNRLHNPAVQSIYRNVHSHGVSISHGVDGRHFRSSDFKPSSVEDVYRYGEERNTNGGHLQNYRPIHFSGDYGHLVYYGNSLESGYAQKYGYPQLSEVEAKLDTANTLINSLPA